MDGAGDVETALADFDDNIEWSIPGNSTISGTYRGKDKFMELFGEARGEVLHNNARAFLADGDDVVVITRTTTGEESALQADVLTYRNGKVVKAVSFGDTALQERVWGAKIHDGPEFPGRWEGGGTGRPALALSPSRPAVR